MPTVRHYIILYSKYQIKLFTSRQSYSYYYFFFLVWASNEFYLYIFHISSDIFFDKIKTNFNLHCIVLFYSVPNNRIEMKMLGNLCSFC